MISLVLFLSSTNCASECYARALQFDKRRSSLQMYLSLFLLLLLLLRFRPFWTFQVPFWSFQVRSFHLQSPFSKVLFRFWIILFIYLVQLHFTLSHYLFCLYCILPFEDHAGCKLGFWSFDSNFWINQLIRSFAWKCQKHAEPAELKNRTSLSPHHYIFQNWIISD